MSDVLYKFGWAELIVINAFTLTIGSFLFFISVKLWHKSFKLTGSILPIEGNGDLFNSKFEDTFYVFFMFMMSSFLLLIHSVHLVGLLYSNISNENEIAGRVVSIENRGGTEVVEISGTIFENKLNNRSRPWCFSSSFKELDDSSYYRVTISRNLFSEFNKLGVVCILKIEKI